MYSLWLAGLTLNYVLAAVVMLAVLRQRKEPAVMLAWLLAIFAFPLVGMLAYWLIGSNRVARRHRARLRRVQNLIDWLRSSTQQLTIAEQHGQLPPHLTWIAELGQRLTQYPTTYHNEVEIFEDANETYAALERSIRAATHHVHLEFYLWQDDDTGRFFRDLLIEKARAGVECRLLLDAVGSLSLGQRFLKPLRDAGVRVAFFVPLWLFRRRITLNMRNHRKLAVCDGRVAMLGSQNIGDEYRGRLKKLSPWHDSHMRVRGAAALFVQQTFVEDWALATRERLASIDYFPSPTVAGGCAVQILPTGPDQNLAPLSQIIFAAVIAAQRTITIATPYFVPDAALRLALHHAALRGVRVRVVLPTRTDAPLTLWAARSFYGELLTSGVEVYEYDQGVLHSKMATVDERWALLGTANMDARSFRLNYEITAVIYDEPVAQRLSASILRYCDLARRVTPRAAWQRNWRQELLEGAARLLVPLL